MADDNCAVVSDKGHREGALRAKCVDDVVLISRAVMPTAERAPRHIANRLFWSVLELQLGDADAAFACDRVQQKDASTFLEHRRVT